MFIGLTLLMVFLSFNVYLACSLNANEMFITPIALSVSSPSSRTSVFPLFSWSFSSLLSLSLSSTFSLSNTWERNLSPDLRTTSSAISPSATTVRDQRSYDPETKDQLSVRQTRQDDVLFECLYPSRFCRQLCQWLPYSEGGESDRKRTFPVAPRCEIQDDSSREKRKRGRSENWRRDSRRKIFFSELKGNRTASKSNWEKRRPPIDWILVTDFSNWNKLIWIIWVKMFLTDTPSWNRISMARLSIARCENELFLGSF